MLSKGKSALVTRQPLRKGPDVVATDGPDFVISVPSLKPAFLNDKTDVAKNWVAKMRVLVRQCMSSFEPFDENAHNVTFYREIEQLCAPANRPSRRPSEIEAEIKENLRIFSEQLKSVSAKHGSLYGPEPQNRFFARPSYPLPTGGAVPLYTYIDIEACSAPGGLAGFVEGLLKAFQKQLDATKFDPVDNPHITCHYFGRGAPKEAASVYQLSVQKNFHWRFRYRITHFILAENVVVVAAVEPIGRRPMAEGGRHPHITLAVAPGMQPFVSNGILEGLSDCEFFNGKIYCYAPLKECGRLKPPMVIQRPDSEDISTIYFLEDLQYFDNLSRRSTRCLVAVPVEELTVEGRARSCWKT